MDLSLSLTLSSFPYPALLFDALPWWIAVPMLQLAILVAGMALDETYVNRTTVLAGALALAVHATVAGETGLMVGVYLDVGLVVGAYGLYAYVVDAYVDNWFRVAAYFVYSPLAVFLVILLPDVLFPVALVIAGYANLQLMAYFAPTDPYYFGPETPEAFAEAVAETAADDGQAGTGTGTPDTGPDGERTPRSTPSPQSSSDDTVTDQGVGPTEGQPHATHPGAEPVGTGESTERGILPEFMRRL